MKKHILFWLITLGFILISCSKDEFPTKFSTSPEKPKKNEEITIKYKSDISKLNNSDNLEMIVYSYGTDLLNTNKIQLAKKGEGWIGKFTPEENATGLVVKIKNEDTTDNNNELGYVVKLYNDDGEELAGTNAGLANIYAKWAGALELKIDKDLAKNYFAAEFKKHPEVKRDFLLNYINTLPKNKIDSAARAEVELLEENDNLTKSDLEFLTDATRKIGDHAKSLKYLAMIQENYPDSKLIESRYYSKYRSMITLERKLEVFNEYYKINKDGELMTYMLADIINTEMKNNNFEGAKKMLEEYPQMANSNIFNNIAWKLFESKKHLKEAAELGKKGIELARKQVENPTGSKPASITDEQWKKSKQMSLGMILDTYGNIESELGNKEEESKAFEEAVRITDGEYAEINESYITALFELGKFNLVKEKAEEFISKGKSTDKIKNLLGEAFSELGVDKKEFDSYLSKVEEESNKKMIEKLKKEIISKPAPAFTLKDLKGNTVNLSDYKGKTVIVDFWATWCGPCLQSFPIMQKAVAKYSSNDNVQFIFINAWERVEDKLKNASDFIAKNNYPFHVLLDENNEVIGQFGVEGIPTKFIVDKDGNIRFKSVGLEGTETEVLAEIDQMISMVN